MYWLNMSRTFMYHNASITILIVMLLYLLATVQRHVWRKEKKVQPKYNLTLTLPKRCVCWDGSFDVYNILVW